MATRTTTPRAPGLALGGILLGIAGMVAAALSKFTTGRVVVLIAASGVLGFLALLVVQAVRLKSLRRAAQTIALSLLAVVAGAYLVLFAFMLFCQDAVANQTSAFFQPKPLSAAAARALVTDNVEALDLTTPDGARLRGWLVKNAPAALAPLLIYFEGSGSECSKMIPYARKLDGWSVALVNYRGFGQSTGTPSHAHALADATLLYDTLTQRPDVQARRVVAMGYSLGTGVAVHLAAQRPLAATVLVAPYDRLTLTYVDRPLLWAPLAGAMKPYFDSASRAPTISSPLLCLIGDADTTVPPALSQKLVSQWGGPTTVKTYTQENHDLLLHANGSWADIAAFLRAIK